MRLVAVMVMLLGCGRVHFDEHVRDAFGSDSAQIFGSSGEWIDWDCPGTVPAFACVR